ncbi:MAG: AAA family ATPase [Pseudomonadota bacterium]
MNEYSREVLVSAGVPDEKANRFTECLVFMVPNGFIGRVSVSAAELFWYDYRGERVSLARARLLLHFFEEDAERRSPSASDLLTFAELQTHMGAAATFIGNRRGYRSLVSFAGEDLAKKLLLRANELSALQAFGKNNRLLQGIRAGGRLPEILVSDEEQFAFLSLQKVFEERAAQFPRDFVAISGTLQIAPRTFLPLELEFLEHLDGVQPIAVLIGPNGVGKTRLLLALARASLQGELEVTTYGGEDEAAAPVLVRSRLPVAVFTYERALWKSLPRASLRVVPMGVTTTEWKRLTAILQTLALTDRHEFSISAFLRIVSTVLDVTHLYLPTAVATDADAGLLVGHCVPVRALEGSPGHAMLGQLEIGKEPLVFGREEGSYSLSSGQRSVVLFVANMFLEASRASLILIDEPENHLHPQFISLLMQTLNSTLVATEARAVVVTHSPYVVREVDKGAVRVLRKGQHDALELCETSLQTLGADISLISDYVFGDTDLRKAYERKIDVMFSRTETREERLTLATSVRQEVGADAELYVREKLRQAGDAE